MKAVWRSLLDKEEPTMPKYKEITAKIRIAPEALLGKEKPQQKPEAKKGVKPDG